MSTFAVEYRPEDANPSDLPWCVLKHGSPFIWYRHEVFAKGFALASNAGSNIMSAQDFVRSMPDDLTEAEAFLEDHQPEKRSAK